MKRDGLETIVNKVNPCSFPELPLPIMHDKPWPMKGNVDEVRQCFFCMFLFEFFTMTVYNSRLLLAKELTNINVLVT